MGSQEYSTAVASQASTVWHRQVRGKQWGPGRIGRGVFQVTGISPEKKTRQIWRNLPSGNGKWTRIEDVFPIENGDFSIAMLVYWRVAILSSCFVLLWLGGRKPSLNQACRVFSNFVDPGEEDPMWHFFVFQMGNSAYCWWKKSC